jgi:site-specific recombinase XerD
MINRQNWLDVRAYLRYIERVRQNDSETVKRARSHLRHLLEWADETPLPRARSIDPTLPTYLLTARADGKTLPLASASIVRCLANARQFFEFARIEWPLRYRAVSESWIAFLQPPRRARPESEVHVHEYWTLDEVRQVAAVSTETMREERGKVAVCMLYLSGMRADALASLPIRCVDLAASTIRQIPSEGVRTKNRKAAITYLLDIPDLFARIETWDRQVRATLSPEALWYATLANDGMHLTETRVAFEGRNNVIQRDLKVICQRAGLPYKSPHKLRHGHAVYALKLARDMAGLKAISQNLMHTSVTITDSIYGGLTGEDIHWTIAHLGQSSTGGEVEQKLNELIALLQNKKAPH